MVGIGVAKKRTLEFDGGLHLRQRLVLSLLSGQPVRLNGIRADAVVPGLSPSEISFIRLLDKLTAGSGIHINDSGTILVFRPGHLSGPASRGPVVHVCHSSRGISYYARPLLAIAPFFKTSLHVILRGATHSMTDASCDTFNAVDIPLLRRLSMGATTLLAPHFEIRKRSLGDDGEVALTCGVLAGKLKPIDLIAPGVIKRIRGLAYASRTSPSALARMVDSTRGVLNRFTPDVYIHTDHGRGARGGSNSQNIAGYALHLMAETTDGCLIAADWGTLDAAVTPERVSQTAINLLCEEIAGGGCIDSDHVPFAMLYCALADSEVSRIRVGKLSDSSVMMLRDLRKFFGVVFKIKVEDSAPRYEDSDSEDESDEGDSEEDENEGTGEEVPKKKSHKSSKQERGIVLSCVGIGQINTARQRF